jgi:16S rRNA (adenine1518-N6/adenine1519-N6)-dimethyltransferase
MHVSGLVHAAFAHRRKTLAGSLALAGAADLRERARAALESVGHPADARAERVAPEEFVRLADLLGADALARIARR